MARAFIRLAAVATCIALSLTDEDRQARSGDLDRGPPYDDGALQEDSFKGRKKSNSVDNLQKDVVEKQFITDTIDPSFESNVNFNNKNYLALLARSQDNILVQDSDKSYGKGIYFVQEIPLSDFEKEVPSKSVDPHKRNNSDNLYKRRVDQPEESKSNNQFKSYSDSERLNNNEELEAFSAEHGPLPDLLLAGTNIFNHLSNLRHKLPSGVNSDISPFTDQASSALSNRHMRSEDIENFPAKETLKEGPSEISFEITDEEAMALKRRVEMSTEFFLIPSSSTSPTSTSGVHITKTVHSEEAEKMGGVFRNEVWVVPVIALSAVTMILIAGFEVFVLCKAWRTTPSRRHLFLGQMLLLGLFACAGLASVVAASPTQFTCALVRFGTGVAYAIVFASLLVKCVFLISLNGGVYLPAPYQGLLLLFAVLIQVAIGVQWLLTSPPLVASITVEQIVHQNRNRLLVTAADISTAQVIPLCRTPYVDMVLSLIYVIFLIIFVTVLAVKSRGIRDNYREATYIGLSVGCSIPTWLIWTVSGLVVNERHRDACIAFGLVIISIMVFLIMFMPKGRQLAAMGKEGVYVEDREERFSSLSRAGSGYSPSFFHFKPIKYGMNHGTKQQHITTLGGGGGGGTGVGTGGGGGDLALYPSPPSYTRFYQYYSSPPGYYSTRYLSGGLYLRPDDGNLYTTLEPTLSSNPNVYFQRGNGLHPGMMY